jgi:glycosyltransferase involved in cell wall biosynthesis
VDDGSRDNTIEVLQALCEGVPDRAAYLACKLNAGKAETVRKGMLYAMQQYELDAVGFWDADLATPLTAIPSFVDVLTRLPASEMVFGARVQLLGRHVHRSPMRHYLGRVFATLASMTLQLAIYDTQCGAKLFRVSADLKQVLAEPFLSKWVFDVEILARYSQLCGHDKSRMELRIYEFPLERWADVAGSKVKPTDFLIAMFDLLRIKLRYLS